jgi:hypothetical protein
MPSYLQIQPAQLIQIISKIKINVLHMEINSNATIQVLAYSEDNQLLTSYVFELNLPEYDYWRDDDYLVDYVCQKYGFTLINNIV